MSVTTVLDTLSTRPASITGLSTPPEVQVTGTSLSDVLLQADVSEFTWAILQFTGTWTGTITIDGSNDNSDWDLLLAYDLASFTTVGFSTLTTNKTAVQPIHMRYLRVRITVSPTGTVEMRAIFRSGPIPVTYVSAHCFGMVAHDQPLQSNPILVAGDGRDVIPQAVSADGDLTRFILDRNGRVLTRAEAPRGATVDSYAQVTGTTADQALMAGGGAGVFRDLTSIVISTPGGASTNTVTIESGGTTTKMVITFPPGGGTFNHAFSPPLKQTTANTTWTTTQSAAQAVNYTLVAVENN